MLLNALKGFVYVIEMSSPRFRTQIGMFVCGVIFEKVQYFLAIKKKR